MSTRRVLRSLAYFVLGYAIGLKRGYWYGWNDGNGFEK